MRLQRFGTTRDIDVLGAGGNFPIAEVVNDLEDLRPAREWAVIDPPVFIDGHYELEKLAGDLALFGSLADFSPPPARSTTPVHPRPPIRSAPPAISALSARPAIRSCAVFRHTRKIGQRGPRLDNGEAPGRPTPASPVRTLDGTDYR